MTDDIQYGLGAIQNPPDDRDYDIQALYAARAVREPVALPTSLMVGSPYPPVLDQDGTPQCVAYSSSWLKAYEDLRDQGSFNFDEGLFFSQIGGTSAGAYTRDAFQRMLTSGYPVVGNAAAASQHKIAAYYSVPIDKTAIMQALYSFGPLVISTPWYNNWFSTDADGDLRAPGSLVGGHAIAVIGYDQYGLWLQNSWGTGFGVNGGKCRLPWAYLGVVWDCWKAVDVIEPKPAPTVVLKYGGYAGFRGRWQIISAGSRFRSRPYTTAPIIAVAGPTYSGLGGYVTNGQFSNSQTTDLGTYVNGSRRWLGDATGDKWMHVSLVRLVR